MAVKNFYVVAAHEFDLTMWLDSVLTISDIGINSVKDMVDKLVAQCTAGHTIGQLTIFGHGSEFGQYIGGDWVTRSTLGRFRRDLVRLNRYWARRPARPEVIMGGCRQGRNGGFLLALSDLWGVPVSGFTALQRPALPGDEGGRTTCFITCTREGETVADDIDEIQLSLMREQARCRL